MTQDAIDEAARIKALIAALTNEQITAEASVAKLLPSLTDEQRTSVANTINSAYTELITAQQSAFSNLPADFTKS